MPIRKSMFQKIALWLEFDWFCRIEWECQFFLKASSLQCYMVGENSKDSWTSKCFLLYFPFELSDFQAIPLLIVPIVCVIASRDSIFISNVQLYQLWLHHFAKILINHQTLYSLEWVIHRPKCSLKKITKIPLPRTKKSSNCARCP